MFVHIILLFLRTSSSVLRVRGGPAPCRRCRRIRAVWSGCASASSPRVGPPFTLTYSLPLIISARRSRSSLARPFLPLSTRMTSLCTSISRPVCRYRYHSTTVQRAGSDGSARYYFCPFLLIPILSYLPIILPSSPVSAAAVAVSCRLPARTGPPSIVVVIIVVRVLYLLPHTLTLHAC